MNQHASFQNSKQDLFHLLHSDYVYGLHEFREKNSVYHIHKKGVLSFRALYPCNIFLLGMMCCAKFE